MRGSGGTAPHSLHIFRSSRNPRSQARSARTACLPPLTPTSTTPFSASSRSSASTTAALDNCARISLAPTNAAKRSCWPGSSAAKVRGHGRNGDASSWRTSTERARARATGMKAVRIRRRRAASAKSISISTFTFASGGKARALLHNAARNVRIPEPATVRQSVPHCEHCRAIHNSRSPQCIASSI